MTDEYSFEQISSLNWLKSISQKTQKHMFPSNSQPSHQDIFHQLFNPQQPQWTTDSFNRKAHLRSRNKDNVRNYRERKKNQNEHMKQRIEQLEGQNKSLRKNKYCKWCNKCYQPLVHCTYSHMGIDKSLGGRELEGRLEQQKMEMEFEKPDISNLHKKLNGKIWIALGILMLVLGLTFHGFDGNKEVFKQIQIHRQQAQHWVYQFKSKDKMQDFKVKMRFKLQAENDKVGMDDLPSSSLLITYANTPDGPKEHYRQEEVSINKQLLYSIHAEIEDIGVYM